MKLHELTKQDLEKCPYWLYEGINDENAKIINVNINEIIEGQTYLAKTLFILNDGTKLMGYCSPEDDSGTDYTQPTIILNEKHFNLFELTKFNSKYHEIIAEELNKKLNEIFPIKIECQIDEKGIKYSETIK